jgi:hypothetical protein
VAAGANPLIVITDPSDPEAVIVPSAAPLQDTFVALADTVTLLLSNRYCCCSSTISISISISCYQCVCSRSVSGGWC